MPVGCVKSMAIRLLPNDVIISTAAASASGEPAATSCGNVRMSFACLIYDADSKLD